jgi:hypothetical protein
MQLSTYNFRFICEIIPELENNDSPKEYMPQSKFHNLANLPLHPYGNGPFCRFRIPNVIHKTGVYVVLVDEIPKYAGECEDLSKRWNTGYGNISPRNCFRKGQETNCRINNLLLTTFKSGSRIELMFHETDNRFEVENDLIVKLEPEWGIEKRTITKLRFHPIAKHANLGHAGFTRSKYQKLAEYLRNSPKNIENLTYSDIERITGTKLPFSAYHYREWWSNTSHSHAKNWTRLNWIVDSVNLGKIVTFKRKSN